jgi:hypothetical protein
MPIPRHTKADAREQLHDLSAGFREVAENLGVPAGIPDGDNECDLDDSDSVRESILNQTDSESENRREGVVL